MGQVDGLFGLSLCRLVFLVWGCLSLWIMDVDKAEKDTSIITLADIYAYIYLVFVDEMDHCYITSICIDNSRFFFQPTLFSCDA